MPMHVTHIVITHVHTSHTHEDAIRQTGAHIPQNLSSSHTHVHSRAHRQAQMVRATTHTASPPPQGHTDTLHPRSALSWSSHTQTQTEEAVTEACTHHSRPQHQYIRFISPVLSRDSRYPNLNKNRAQGWGAALWVGQNTNLTSPGLGPSPGTPPKCDWAPCAQACGPEQEQHQQEGGLPESEPVGRSTSTAARSGLQPPDLQRQAPRGSYHQVALSTDPI